MIKPHSGPQKEEILILRFHLSLSGVQLSRIGPTDWRCWKKNELTLKKDTYPMINWKSGISSLVITGMEELQCVGISCSFLVLRWSPC